MDILNLEKILAPEPKYRLSQVKSAIFRDLIEDWSEVKSLPKELRKELVRRCPLAIEAKVFYSKDGAIKIHLVLADHLKVESVLLRHAGNRNTACVSSQAGCPLGCQICFTGKIGFKRNLSSLEIVEQVLFFARLLKQENQKITSIVFMGMGEPFLNYDNALGAIKVLNDKGGFNLGARHFSISTVGIVEGIEKLSEESLQVNLAISLHAPEDKLRERIMPINKLYPIKKILGAVRDYIKKTNRRVMFEYAMIRGVNDSDECAQKLAELIRDISLSFVNLISYNPTGIFSPSSPERIKKFGEILLKHGISVTKRHRFGRDIKAACGQLGFC